MKLEHSCIHLPGWLLQVYLTLPAQLMALAHVYVVCLYQGKLTLAWRCSTSERNLGIARIDNSKRQEAHMIFCCIPAMLLPLQHGR